MVDISELVKSLGQQVDIITGYLEKQKLSALSFIPGSSKHPLQGIPAEIEEARIKAKGIGTSLDLLLTRPDDHLFHTAFKAPPGMVFALTIVLRYSSSTCGR